MIRGSLAILAAIIGYILFNVAVIESGTAVLNYGLMNFTAGMLTLMIFRKEIRSYPKWEVSILGAIGIIAILFGLRWTHSSLQDPSSTMEVIYYLVVVSSVGLWALVEGPLGLQHTKLRKFDIVLHVCMLLLVTSRLMVHWSDGWNFASFAPALLAVIGYWLFNVSVRLSQKDPGATRITNVTMNLVAGSLLICLSVVLGGEFATVNHGSLIGSVAILVIVYALGVAYRSFGPIGLAPMVVAGTYDGLLVFAPIALSVMYRQKFGAVDFVFTLGFVAVMAIRAWLYYRHTK